MHSRKKMLSLGLSALAIGGTLTGLVATQGMVAFAGSGAIQADARKAQREAGEARELLARGKAEKALPRAELAVSLDPRNSAHRALLGQVYLMSGRFTSASQALTDALSLDPADGRSALNLALAQIGTGDWAGARATLDAHTAQIPAGDRGLAYALAGDPMKGIEILGPAAREVGATSKVRQNLALSLALAGRWQEAKVVASMDLSPADLDARIAQWAAFSRPVNAYDQVSSLLGVRAVMDAGQPVALALNNSTTTMAAAVQTVDPADAVVPAETTVAAVEPAPAPVVTEVAAPAPAPAIETGGKVTFAARQEVVQSVPTVAAKPVRTAAVAPAPARAATPAPAPRAATPARQPAKGNFYVQLGAYDSAAVARDAWKRATGRYSALGAHSPSGVEVSTSAGKFYRLSVGGFARADAVSLCVSIKANGGSCFVRASAGDVAANWARGTAVASR